MLHISGSTTPCTSAQAIAASTALPPRFSITAPASTASGCGAEMTPCVMCDPPSYQQRHAVAAGIGALHAQTRASGALPEDEVAAVFEAFRRDMVTRFAIDLEQVYVAGLSQTGFWSWYLGRELADRLAGIAPMGAVTWGVDKALENLLHLPTFVIHGSEDPICPVAQPRATTRRMQELGVAPGDGDDRGLGADLHLGGVAGARRPG